MCWRRVDSALVPGTGRVDCKDLCATWAVDHLFSRVGRPTGNALAERLIKTLKVELVWTRDWDTLEWS